MNSTNTVKSINSSRFAAATKALKGNLTNARLRHSIEKYIVVYPVKNQIKGVSAAPFKTSSFYFASHREILNYFASHRETLKHAPISRKKADTLVQSEQLCAPADNLKRMSILSQNHLGEQIRRYGQGRNELYAETLISRYFDKTEDINQLRKFFRLQIQELQQTAGFLINILQYDSCDSLRKLDLGKFTEENARLILLVIQLCELLDESMENVRIWLDSPHPSLGNRKPISYLLEGKPDAVEILLYAVETGQPI